MALAVFQGQRQSELIGGERAGSHAGAQSLEHSRQQKEKRFQEFDRVVELHFLVKAERVFEWPEMADTFAARQTLQQSPLGSQARRDPERRQRDKLPETANPPCRERFGYLGRTGKKVQRQGRQCLRFVARRNDRNAAKASGGENRGIGVAGDCYVDNSVASPTFRRRAVISPLCTSCAPRSANLRPARPQSRVSNPEISHGV